MKKIVLLLLTFFCLNRSFAGEFNEALKNGILVISTTKDYWIEGIQKSSYNLTDLEIIPDDKGTAKDGMIYFYSTYSSSTSGSYFKLFFKHQSEVYLLKDFRFNIKNASDVRRFMHYIETVINEYITYADEEGKIDKSIEKKRLESVKNNWADSIKNATFYVVGNVKSEQIKAWDKKNYGKVKKVSIEDLNRIVENGEDSTGYYILSTKTLRGLWLTGFFTGYLGFIVAPTIPKHKIIVYSTNKDQFITAYRSYNPVKKIKRIQKQIKKNKTSKN